MCFLELRSTLTLLYFGIWLDLSLLCNIRVEFDELYAVDYVEQSNIIYHFNQHLRVTQYKTGVCWPQLYNDCVMTSDIIYVLPGIFGHDLNCTIHILCDKNVMTSLLSWPQLYPTCDTHDDPKCSIIYLWPHPYHHSVRGSGICVPIIPA